MKRLVRTVLFVTSLATVSTMGLAAQVPTDEDQLRQLFEEYIMGWRDGDADRLRHVFAVNEGRVMWVSGDSLSSMTFGQVLQRRRPQPQYGLQWEIQSLDIVDDKLAVARLFISRRGGSYTDYYVCYKMGGEWRIVNKTFTVR